MQGLADQASEQPWPDYCCVAALVEGAIVDGGGDPPARRSLALLLGIKVPSETANPLDLPIAFADEESGLRIADALFTIPRALDTMQVRLTFSFEAFSRIPLSDYEGRFASLRASNCYVGLGMNWPVLFGASAVSKHVVQVLAYTEQWVELYDPLAPTVGVQRYRTQLVERAVRQFDDGFWVFRNVGATHLDT